MSLDSALLFSCCHTMSSFKDDPALPMSDPGSPRNKSNTATAATTTSAGALALFAWEAFIFLLILIAATVQQFEMKGPLDLQMEVAKMELLKKDVPPALAAAASLKDKEVYCRSTTPTCLTMWGAKAKCSCGNYIGTGKAAFGCATRRNNMNGAAAFAVFSLALLLTILVLSGLTIAGGLRIPTMVPPILSAVATATLLVSWACVAGVYSIHMCKVDLESLLDGDLTSTADAYDGKLMNMGFQFGAGFGLLVTGWVLQVFHCVLSFLSIVM